MKCNPLSWLWGLLPLALLTWVAWLAETPKIERDLTSRSAAALAQKGLAWAMPSFTGRDGVVAGRAGEESEQKQAASVISSVWGVQSVADRTDVIELIKNYTWTAAARDNAVRLTGYVPSETARKEIIGTAKATFPGRTVDDQMKLARGAPDPTKWLSGITFGMKQLAGLKSGAKVDLDSQGLAIEGEAENANVYKAVKTALSGNRPQGLGLKSDKVVAPLAKPYTWAASLAGQQVELTGHVPSERQREQVLAEAKKSFPRATVSDKMVVGSGEPGDWQKVVTTALARLGQLSQGKADVRDSQVTLSGLAEREDIVEAVRRSLKSDIPASFKVTEQVLLDPKFRSEEENRRMAAEEAAKRAAAEAAGEQARRAAADEAARRAAAEAEAKRVADLQRQQADDQGRRKAAEEAAAKAAADEASRQRVAAADVAVRQRETAVRCQDSLRAAAKDGSINFQRASAELEQVSFATLKKLADIAKTCPDAVIEIAGHTDAEGEPARNQRLSERRARSVADYLVKAGVPDARLAAVGLGDTQPIAPNATPEDRAKNRRIEFNVKAK